MTLSFQKKTLPVDKTKPENKKEPVNNQDNHLNGIGPYEFIKPLGSGKFSKVMLAYHLETHQQVAIKVRVNMDNLYLSFLTRISFSKDYR